MSKYHYVYRITNTKEQKHYYGVRSSKIEPKLDLGIKYFSSSRDKEFMNEQKENKSIFKYKVIKIFETRKEAVKLEIKLHSKFDVGLNESFYNKAKQTSTGFDTSGISVNKGKVTALDTRDGKVKHVTMADYRMYDYYQSIIGTKTDFSIDKKNLPRKPVSDETREKQSKARLGKPMSDETKAKLSKINKGKKLSQDTKDKLSASKKGCIISDVHITKIKSHYVKTYEIYDDSDLLIHRMYCTKSDFLKISKELNIPSNNLYKNKNNKIFQGVIDNGNLNKFKQKGWYPRCVGWKLIIT